MFCWQPFTVKKGGTTLLHMHYCVVDSDVFSNVTILPNSVFLYQIAENGMILFYILCTHNTFYENCESKETCFSTTGGALGRVDKPLITSLHFFF